MDIKFCVCVCVCIMYVRFEVEEIRMGAWVSLV